MNEDLKEKLKFNISISQIKEKEKIVMKKSSKNISKKIGIAACLLIATTGIVFANDIGNIFKNIFGGNASDGVQIAVENGYIQEVEPEYKEANGIEIAVDSFLIDDYNFDMNFKIKLNDTYNVNEMRAMQLYDMKVVDENNDIVFLAREAEKSIAQENEKAGTPNNEPLFWGGYSMYADITGENEMTLHLTSQSGGNQTFPKSKKLYVTFSQIQNETHLESNPSNTIYTGDWKFELDVPKEMYNREISVYKVKSCSDENTKVENAILSNTAFKISISETTTDKIDYDLLQARPPKNISDMIALGKEYVETLDGKRFEISGRNDGDGGYSIPQEYKKVVNYHQTFNLTKFDATDILKVHIFTNKGEEIIIEYEKI